MQQIQPNTIRTMTMEELREYGINHGMMLDYECVSYRLSAGTSDDIHVFKSGALYVLTINNHLDYVGLDAYIGAETDPVDSIFLHGDWAIRECVGNDWRSLSLVQLATRLLQLFA